MCGACQVPRAPREVGGLEGKVEGVVGPPREVPPSCRTNRLDDPGLVTQERMGYEM